ncbi:MAG: FHA domain-containing protein [Myxococcales bacterium]|nr:FHA domain-containing protein [Myxococcales bacterium]
MFKLVISDDEGKTTVVPLVRDEITIGRKEGNTIRLTERNVSRRHARIVRAGDQVEVEDLGSYNGVRVNGVRIDVKQALSMADRVQIGDYLIELKAEASAQLGPAGAPTSQMAAVGGGNTEPTAIGVMSRTITAPDVAVVPPPEALAADSSQFVRNELDADPTVPVRASASGSLASQAGFARLVVLSTSYAGEEFVLNHAQAIIGRDSDSEISLDHKSLSRSHARIVRELDTGAYHIEDLESANGVRVNGSPQLRSPLGRGDLIELGDLKLRFVAAGEEFSFSPEHTLADASEPPRGGKTLWIVLGVIAAAGIIGWQLVSQSSSTASLTPKAPDAATQALDAAVPVIDAALVDAAIADAALVDAAAIDATMVVMAPDAAQAPIAPRPEAAFAVAVKAGQHEAAFELWRASADDPAFVAAAARDKKTLERAYTAAQLAAAKPLSAAKDCAAIEALATQAAANSTSTATSLRTLAAKCVTAAAAPVTSEPKPEKKPKPTLDASTTPVVTAPTTGDPSNAAEAIAIARDAAFNGFHAKAARYAATALKFEGGNVDALQILVLSNCKMGKADEAKRFAGKLPAASRSAVRQVCLSHGVTLD